MSDILSMEDIPIDLDLEKLLLKPLEHNLKYTFRGWKSLAYLHTLDEIVYKDIKRVFQFQDFDKKYKWICQNEKKLIERMKYMKSKSSSSSSRPSSRSPSNSKSASSSSSSSKRKATSHSHQHYPAPYFSSSSTASPSTSTAASQSQSRSMSTTTSSSSYKPLPRLSSTASSVHPSSRSRSSMPTIVSSSSGSSATTSSRSRCNNNYAANAHVMASTARNANTQQCSGGSPNLMAMPQGGSLQYASYSRPSQAGAGSPYFGAVSAQKQAGHVQQVQASNKNSNHNNNNNAAGYYAQYANCSAYGDVVNNANCNSNNNGIYAPYSSSSSNQGYYSYAAYNAKNASNSNNNNGNGNKKNMVYVATQQQQSSPEMKSTANAQTASPPQAPYRIKNGCYYYNNYSTSGTPAYVAFGSNVSMNAGGNNSNLYNKNCAMMYDNKAVHATTAKQPAVSPSMATANKAAEYGEIAEIVAVDGNSQSSQGNISSISATNDNSSATSLSSVIDNV
mmetsp:Transcript_73052/g.116516  ORF Transcript_73052/g.116516 Transcript_73052/m.116516 type:complete len:505 (-) Transcript_73052:1449-2963(-)